MGRLLRTVLGSTVAVAAVIACTSQAGPASAADAAYDVLVFSKTAGFRHDSIPDGVAAVKHLGETAGFRVRLPRSRRSSGHRPVPSRCS